MKIIVSYDEIQECYRLNLNGAKCIRNFNSPTDVYVYVLESILGHKVVVG